MPEFGLQPSGNILSTVIEFFAHKGQWDTIIKMITTMCRYVQVFEGMCQLTQDDSIPAHILNTPAVPPQP